MNVKNSRNLFKANLANETLRNKAEPRCRIENISFFRRLENWSFPKINKKKEKKATLNQIKWQMEHEENEYIYLLKANHTNYIHRLKT